MGKPNVLPTDEPNFETIPNEPKAATLLAILAVGNNCGSKENAAGFPLEYDQLRVLQALPSSLVPPGGNGIFSRFDPKPGFPSYQIIRSGANFLLFGLPCPDFGLISHVYLCNTQPKFQVH